MKTITNPPNTASNTIPSYLDTGRGYRLAYHRTEGKGLEVLFMGGFRSDMTGSKAIALENFCKEKGLTFTRFDYFGHGQSEGSFEEGTIGQWKEDALTIIDKITKGQLILIGSSMGGWIMLLATLERKKRVAGLIGIAAAPDFTETLIWQALSEKDGKALVKKGSRTEPDCYSDKPYIITHPLIEEGRKHLLLNRRVIDINCPVRLLHGMEDEDVPWQFSMALNEKLATDDVKLNVIMDGNHRLSEPKHLAILCKTLEKLLNHIA